MLTWQTSDVKHPPYREQLPTGPFVKRVCGRAQFRVERRQGPLQALGRFQICGVVDREPVPNCQPGRCDPCLAGRVGVEVDEKVVQEPGQAKPLVRAEALRAAAALAAGAGCVEVSS
jgi:hypothetical protein